MKISVQKSRHALVKFFHSKGGKLVTLALKVFSGRVISQMLYGIEIWGMNQNNLHHLEVGQNKFLRHILVAPQGTPAAHLRTETGMVSIKARATLAIFSYYKRVMDMPDHRLPKRCMIEQWKSGGWATSAQNLLKSKSLSTDIFIFSEVKRMLRDWLYKSDNDQDLALIHSSGFSHWYRLLKTNHSRAQYLDALTFAPLRTAFTELRFQTMPTAVLDGRYMNVPKHLRVCICGAGEIEDVLHYLLYCHLYQNPREKLLGNILAALQEESPQTKVVRLLLDCDPYVTYRTALFAKAARNIRANFLKAIAINCVGDSQI